MYSSACVQTEIRIDHGTNSYYEVSAQASTSNGDAGKKLKKAEITLNDCLACSGCVTSAESVLVAMQSHEEVYKVLEEQPVSAVIHSGAEHILMSATASHSHIVDSTSISGILGRSAQH